MTNSPTLLLVDGSSYLYRAYHAMPDLRAVPGDPGSPATGAIRGMVNMLQALTKEPENGRRPPTPSACSMPAAPPSATTGIRNTRPTARPCPTTCAARSIHPRGGAAAGLEGIERARVEADDVIATLACTAASQGVEVIVSSGDKDLSQLVNDHITIIDTMSGKRRDVAGVEQEFGVPPALMIDYQALVGDAVDNVPGVTKVGPKTAVKWLQEFGALTA